jgi:hypothetical protein
LSEKVGLSKKLLNSVELTCSDDSILKIKPWDLEMPLPNQQIVSRYCNAMKEISFQESEFDFAATPSSSTSQPSPDLQNPVRLKTIAKEIAVLSTSLPIDYSTSAFIRMTSKRFDAFLLGLIGPEGNSQLINRNSICQRSFPF